MPVDLEPSRVVAATDLAALDTRLVEGAFREHGWIVVRGCPPAPATFDALARRFTASHFLGYGRQPFADFPAITTGNETQLPLAPHTDNGIRPEDQRPDITWFLCERPADDAGETLFYDGVRVWNLLAPGSRERLLSQRIRFHIRTSWQRLRFPDRAAFERFVAAQSGTIGATHPDGSVDMEVLIPAVRRTRWGNQLAFTSSLALAGTPSFESLRVSLEGEAGLPDELRSEIDDALEACCEVLAWRAGDIVMLDNTRFLHGRRGFRDPARRIYLIQTLRASF